MSLLNPAALLWAGLAVPIVIFYILKIRMRRVPVSTVMFWQQIFEEKQPRSIWQTLRHLLSLLVQLAFLMLLVFALTEPFFPWQVQDARRLVLVIDNSASMRATDVEPTRLDAARTQAHAIITSLKLHDEMAVVAAGTQPRVLCGLTGHQRTLREAVDGLPVTDGPTRVVEAVELARRLIADHEHGNVIILSDGCFKRAETLAKADDVIWMPVGEKTDNVAITRFQVRRSLLDPVGYEILAEVKNFSEKPVELRLEIELDSRVVDVIPLKLDAEETWSQVFEKTSTEGGRLLASLDRNDALGTDNVAHAILPKRNRQRVALVTEGNLFLERVFQANRLVDLKVSTDAPAKTVKDAITVFHGKVPSTVPPGNVIVIDPENSTDVWELADVLENPIVAKQDKDSPLMAHVRLDNVLMPEAHRLKLQGEANVLVQAVSGDPLYFWIQRPGGNLLVLTVNLDRGDLPLRTAFPILISNALSWFAGRKGELRESLATGTVTEIELDESLLKAGDDSADSELVLQSPDGRELPLATGSTAVTIGPLDRCGIWRIARKTTTEQDQAGESTTVEIDRFACNLASRDESDLRSRVEPSEAGGKALAAGFGGRPVWFYLIAVAWLLVVVEWYLYQRRWIR